MTQAERSKSGFALRIENSDGEFKKMRDNVWYELEYADFYCNYMLKKEFACVQTVEELEALLK